MTIRSTAISYHPSNLLSPTQLTQIDVIDMAQKMEIVKKQMNLVDNKHRFFFPNPIAHNHVTRRAHPTP
jgi:hypothetical protein